MRLYDVILLKTQRATLGRLGLAKRFYRAMLHRARYS